MKQCDSVMTTSMGTDQPSSRSHVGQEYDPRHLLQAEDTEHVSVGMGLVPHVDNVDSRWASVCLPPSSSELD